MAESHPMRRATFETSTPLVLGGLLAALAPAVVLGFSQPEPYEVEIVRWSGAAALGLGTVRPWALRAGSSPARRMRRWNAATVASVILYLLSTNPVFLVCAFATLAASALDAGVERAVLASGELLHRLQREAAGAGRRGSRPRGRRR